MKHTKETTSTDDAQKSEKPEHHAHKAGALHKAKAFIKTTVGKIIIIALCIFIIFLIWWLVVPSNAHHEQSSAAEAQDIVKLIAAQNVTVQRVVATSDGYEITYAAESAVGRFDNAIVYDWATIYAVAANHRCDKVSIVTTLDNQSMERQTASCPAVRALARGVLTEKEFWMLVKHESIP